MGALVLSTTAMRPGWCIVVVVLALILQPAHAFVSAAPLLFPVWSRAAGLPGSRPSKTAICSTKKPAPDADGRPTNNKRAPRGKVARTSRSDSTSSSKNNGGARRPRRPTPLSPTASSSLPRAAEAVAATTLRERSERLPTSSANPDLPQYADMHVLVPIKDVVPMPLSDIAQAVADSLGGGEATRVSMERFYKTLESVFRTEFSVKVDRANASLVLGGRRYGNASSRSSSRAAGSGSAGLLAPPQQQAGKSTVGAGTLGKRERGGNGEAPAVAASGARQGNASNGYKSKRSKWKMALRRGKKSGGAAGGEKEEEEEKEEEGPPAPAEVAIEGGRLLGRRGGATKERNSNGNGGSTGADGEITDVDSVVPLLELVEELVRNAMFSPIGARDVVMSQALAAEFPTAAGVRPVFGNLANVYELLRSRSSEEEGQAADRGKDAAARKDVSDSERAMLPFEGRLLMFRRGNGVEETTGRLLLKKLDYLQSNAVGWLTQSITDNLKTCQQQVVTAVDIIARDFARKKDSFVRSCAEAAIAFGLERDSLARFLPVANATEMALTKEQEVLNDALEALRRNSRRGPVNLQRYGMRQVNVKLEEFAEGGAWPPEDDSWFWDENPSKVANNAGRDVQGGVFDEGTGVDELAAGGDEVPSTVLPRVTLASVLSPGSFPRRPANGATLDSNGRSSKSSKSSKKGRRQLGSELEPKSVLSRLLSKCTVKEPTYDEVVVVYFKKTRRPIFRAPSALAVQWKFWSKIGNKMRGVEQEDAKPDDADKAKGAGLGLQLRVYRGVPLVNLNAIAPDKKVEVRPQTALRLDLNSVVGLGLVLANLRFDSPVLVAAATVSVVLLVIRTIVGYLNARVRVESFVSRDILDKTMGSNVPVLRHLAEEAAQQKSRHVALVYAALLQCAIDASPEPKATDAADGVRLGSLAAISMAAISRHCGDFLSSLSLGGEGMPREAKVDVPYWLDELENLKILVRVDPDRGGDPSIDEDIQRSLPLALEGLRTDPSVAAEAAAAGTAVSSPVVFYRLLDPEAAVGQLKLKWSELVEPPAAASGVSADGTASWDGTPWVRGLGIRSDSDSVRVDGDVRWRF